MITPGKGVSAAQAINTPISTGGASAGGNALSSDKDAKKAATQAEFGDVWKQIQSQYGGKAAKPREIKKQLGKDDFLRIMLTQMQHQDPTQPFSAEKMATEMAQFTSIEQLQNLNTSMNKLGDNQKPLERLTMTGMIGKTVTVDRERFPHKEGENSALAFTLPRAAKSTTVTVLSENGETILRKDIGPMKEGENTFSWDGLKTNTLAAKSGNYMFRIEAKDAKEMSIATSPQGTATVVGVSFEGSDPVFLVGDPKQPSRVMMRNIVRVEGNSANQVPGARSLSSAVAAAQGGSAQGALAPSAPAGPNLFTFNKGEGSKNVDAAAMPPQVLAALQAQAREKARAAMEEAEAPAQVPQEAASTPGAAIAAGAPSSQQGFPNGLSGE